MMNLITILFFILQLSIVSIGLAEQANNEFRATWVITWEHIDQYKNPGQNMEKIRKIMSDHKAANMNAVIFQVRQSGTAYYQSSYEPWGYYAGYQYPGYDPLEYAIEEAHKHGLELHAWFNVFQTSSTYPGTPAAEHPEWICRDQNGIPMTSYRSVSPGLEEVKNYTINVAMEIVRNYDIDGLHLDYIRWNEHTNTGREAVEPIMELQRRDGLISSEELQNLNNNPSGRYLYDYNHRFSSGIPEGFDSWENWWRWSVTTFVETLHDSIQSVKPQVRLSAAVLGKYNWSGWQGYGTVYQDGAKWYNEGSIDHIMPMSYHWTTASGFTGMLEDNCPQCWRIFVEPGLESGRSFTVGPGSYILDENNVWYRHPDIVANIRSINWVKGFQFFSYRSWDENNYFNTAGQSFFQGKTKVHPTPNIFSIRPNKPLLAINAVDSVTMELTVYPSTTNESGWLIIYRSMDPMATPDIGEIISIQYKSENITYTDYLSDTDLVYQYFATQTDRFWNESESSNRVYTSSGPMPDKYKIAQNYPNPFNGMTTIPFAIPDYSHVNLSITDIRGNTVATLINQPMLPGNHTINWYGKSDAGNHQASGVYLIYLNTGGTVKHSKRLLYLK
jgi:uncharacterized lipoprotein YddW (UPF0748 family)